nr:DotU family type IV/VI secretion system protein [Pseudenhygromyxa sp. WMMC2535]
MRAAAPGFEGAPARTRAPRLETAWRGLEGEPGRAQAGAGAAAASWPQAGPAQAEAQPFGASALRVIEQGGELERGVLGQLQAQVRDELERLWSKLRGEPGFEGVRRTLLIYFDERIMGDLPDYLRLSWPLLQTEVTGSTSGGVDFYRFVEVDLDEPGTPSLIFEVEYFCLRHGFRGRLASALAEVEGYERRLLLRIKRPKLQGAAGLEGGPAPRLGRPWPVWAYYAIAFVLAVVFVALVTTATNHEDVLDRRAEVGRRGR